MNVSSAVGRTTPGPPARREAIEHSTPLRRTGLPEEVAAAVVFLASPAAGYLTGASLPVSGGQQRSVVDLPVLDL